MVRRIAGVAVVALLVSLPAAGSDLRDHIAKAARAEAARQTQSERVGPAGRIPPKYLWTGLGLLMGGAWIVGVLQMGDCTGSLFDPHDCDAGRREAYTVAAGSAVAGLAVLVVGSSHREANALTLAPRRMAVRRTLRF